MSLGQIVSVVNRLIPSLAVDVVGVFDANFEQVFVDARPIKAVIKETSKLMEHPVENGSTITEYRIIMPIEIELSMIFRPENLQNAYQQIKQLRQDGTLLTVQTRTGSYPNQLISDFPHEEDAAMFDTIAMGLKLKEVMFATAQYAIAPKNPANKSTVDRGNQQAKPVQESKLAESFLTK